MLLQNGRPDEGWRRAHQHVGQEELHIECDVAGGRGLREEHLGPPLSKQHCGVPCADQQQFDHRQVRSRQAHPETVQFRHR